MSADEAFAVEVDGVVKRFGRQVALNGADLRVRRGEVYGLVGPNAGTVRVLGRRLPDLGVLARVGYMTQAAALYPDLSVAENLRFFAAISGGVGHVDEALRFVDMEDRRDSVVSTLSGGMRTRVSLACALVHRPELLLLDEPTVGVDPQLRAQLWDRFRAMTRNGTSIVVSSHVMDEAERCDRLGLVRLGRVLAEGTADELRRLAGSDHLEDAFLKLSKEVPA